MSIPNEAVAAAEEAAHDAAAMWKWSELDHHESRQFFTAILEAAAPHMMAEAWQKGRGAGQMDPYDRYPAANPYRSEP